ncbi:MAG TPA: diaminopimelate decarboxylase [Acetobacteraceae bacterium]|nr:diaminopimelate decarboxylase [Acetobacteraceae bacterium]
MPDALPRPLADPDPSIRELIAARPALSLHARDGLLLEEVPLGQIAAACGTPAWVIGARTIRARLAALGHALEGLGAHIHYAVKANDQIAVLSLMAAAGAGADIVSAGELLRARHAGIPAARIVFSGVGKQPAELRLALAEGVGQFNAESAEELEMLSAVAAAEGRTASVALRVNPHVDAGTHDKISTGRAGDKFGIPFGDIPALYARAAGRPGIVPVGLAVHIGSQVMTTGPYRAAYARLAALVRELRAAGQTVSVLDCGGGLGIPYRDEPVATPAALAGAIRAAFGALGLRLIVEPGRWLVGPAGVLLASVVLVKKAPIDPPGGAPFVVLDAGMNDLLRPAMYGAWHGIVPLDPTRADAPTAPADVVGPVCESADIFARGRMLPAMAAGDFVAILDAGAYGSVMSSTYNARPLAPQVMVDGARWTVIRDRQPAAALWAEERVPAWQFPTTR